MNTASLKRFAQQARAILKEGVQARLRYWGFDNKGSIVYAPVYMVQSPDAIRILAKWLNPELMEMIKNNKKIIIK